MKQENNTKPDGKDRLKTLTTASQKHSRHFPVQREKRFALGRAWIERYGSIGTWDDCTYHHVANTVLNDNNGIKGLFDPKTISLFAGAVHYYNKKSKLSIQCLYDYTGYMASMRKALEIEMDQDWGVVSPAAPDAPQPGRLSLKDVIYALEHIPKTQIEGRREIDTPKTTIEGCMEIVRELVTDPVLRAVPGQAINMGVLENTLKKYDSIRRAAGGTAAVNDMRISSFAGVSPVAVINNILNRSYLPNFRDYYRERLAEDPKQRQ